MKKVLVTGGCGFIGHALTLELIERGYDVDVIDNLSIGREAKIPKGCNFLGGDIRGMDNIKDTPYDYIFPCSVGLPFSSIVTNTILSILIIVFFVSLFLTSQAIVIDVLPNSTNSHPISTISPNLADDMKFTSLIALVTIFLVNN